MKITGKVVFQFEGTNAKKRIGDNKIYRNDSERLMTVTQ